MKAAGKIMLAGLLVISAMASVSATENEGTFVLQPPKNQADRAKPSGKVQAAYNVNYVSFTATPKQLNTSCPAKVKFSGKIGSSGPGIVKYRVLFPGAAKTNIRTMKFAAAGKQYIDMVVYKATQSFPNATATLEVMSPQHKKVSTHFKVNCIVVNVPKTIKTTPEVMQSQKR